MWVPGSTTGDTMATEFNAVQAKVDGIEEGAQVNVPTNLSYDTSSRQVIPSTGSAVILPLFSDTIAGLVSPSGGGLVNFLRADGSWAAPDWANLAGLPGDNIALDAILDGITSDFVSVNASISDHETRINALEAGASNNPVLGLFDFWYEFRFGTTNAASPDVFGGGAISTGTNATAPATTAMLGYNLLGQLFRSSTTASSGYTYRTTQSVTWIFGTIKSKYRTQILLPSTQATRVIRAGFHDTATSVDAVDGVYFEINGDVISCKTASNSVRTTAVTTYTLANNVPATLEIDVNAAGTSARFRVFINNSDTPVLDETITTNIPTGTSRSVGVAIVATSSGTTAIDLCAFYSMGCGVGEGYARATGRT